MVLKTVFCTANRKQGYKQTEIGVIPEDWDVFTIEELTPKNIKYTIVDGPFGSNLKTIHYRKKGIPIITSGYVTECKFIANEYLYVDKEKFLQEKRSSVQGGDIVMAKIGERCGASAILPESHPEGILSGNALKIKIDQNKFSNELISQILKNEYFTGRLAELRTVGAQPAISMANLKKYKIPLPPLAEQEAIASALSDADAWIDSLEQLIAKKRLIKQGAMQTLLTPQEDWEVKKLGEVASYRRGSFPQPYGLDKWYDDTNGMPFIQVFDVAKNRKLKIDTKRKISELAQPMSVFVPKGTIVLTIQGSIGRIALTQYDAYCDRTLLIFEKIDSGLDKFYFLLAVEQIFEIEKEKAPGGTIKTITKEALSDFEIKYPKSLSEQERIATILSDMDAELEALETQLGKARHIKQGMMQELLTGRTRLV